MLQQSTAFKKLMWKSIMLVYIAGRTGNHEVIGPIGAATYQRNNVIDMILTQFDFAIIAVPFLISILLLNIRNSDFSLCRALSGNSILLKDSSSLTIGFCILSSYSPALFWISSPVFSIFTQKLFFVGLPVFHRTLQAAFMMSIITRLIPLSDSFSVIPFIPAVNLSGLFLIGISSASLQVALMSLFFMGACISNVAARCSSGFRSAYLTDRTQSAWTMNIEKLRGSGVFLSTWASATFAGRVVLGYHVHDKVYSLSGSGCFQQRGASSCLIPHYTMNPPVESIQEVK